MKERKEQYESRSHRKYYCLAVGVAAGLTLGYLVPYLINKLTHALYQRTQLEKIMTEYLGDSDFETLLTKELMVVAYDYNSQEPRFFTQLYAKEKPGQFSYYVKETTDGKFERQDLVLGEATGASSAAPTFFDPKTTRNGYNMEEL